MKGRRVESLTRAEAELYLSAVTEVLRRHLQMEVGEAVRHLEEAFALMPEIEERAWWTERVVEALRATVRSVDVMAEMQVQVVATPPERVQ